MEQVKQNRTTSGQLKKNKNILKFLAFIF